MASTSIPVGAIILAAGKGTRMKSALPKVMHPIGGQPMVAHVVTRALELDAAPLALVIAPGMDEVAAVGTKLAGEVDVAYQKEQLGTGHAVLAAADAFVNFDGVVLVLYGDTPLIQTRTLQQLITAVTEDKKCAVAVLGFTPDDAGAYGRLVLDDDGNLLRIVEANDATDDELAIDLCNSGVMALRAPLAWQLLKKISNKNAKKEYYLTDVVQLARDAGYTARAVEGDEDEVLGVNSRNELAVAEAIFQYRARAQAMENGATLIDPDSVFFAADTKIGRDVLIEPSVFFGPGVTVADGAHIKAFSHIDGATIGKNTTVGPFARLRPGTELGDDVRIGNFVEIKKSDVAAGAKISHLSYVGDARVGIDANLGAGTITCNYDGYNKHETIIGRDVFIGSNSALVAPVTIGDGAVVAAGSVITKNVAPDALAIARARDEQKQEWAKTFRAKNKKK